MGVFVICAYRPKPGKTERTLELVRDHLPVLRAEGLATDRPSYVMLAADGTVVEVFEWVSEAAVEAAHHNENVMAMWGQFFDACDISTLESLDESKKPFPHFTPVSFG